MAARSSNENTSERFRTMNGAAMNGNRTFFMGLDGELVDEILNLRDHGFDPLVVILEIAADFTDCWRGFIGLGTSRNWHQNGAETVAQMVNCGLQRAKIVLLCFQQSLYFRVWRSRCADLLPSERGWVALSGGCLVECAAIGCL